MGKLKKTLVTVLFILVILTVAIIVYVILRIRRSRSKKEKNKEAEEEELSEEVDEDDRDLQKKIVEKTPLAVQTCEEFGNDDDESLLLCNITAESQNYDQATLWKKYEQLRMSTEMEKCHLTYGRISLEFYHQSYGQILKLKILNAKDLKSHNPRKQLNTRVKILLITPLKTRQIPRRTAVIANSNNPVYEQALEIKLTRKTTRKSTIEVSIWSVDDFYKESLIGGFRINLKNFDVAQRNFVEEEIQVEFEEHENPGFILVSLGYNPEEEKLLVIMMRGKMLKCSAHEETLLQETLNPYAKIYLYCNRKRMKKEKTEVKRDHINPVYNQVIEFFIPQVAIKTTNLVFVFMHKDVRTDSKENIGRIIIGANAHGRCWEHWRKAIASDGKLIAQWHQLWH